MSHYNYNRVTFRRMAAPLQDVMTPIEGEPAGVHFRSVQHVNTYGTAPFARPTNGNAAKQTLCCFLGVHYMFH